MSGDDTAVEAEDVDPSNSNRKVEDDLLDAAWEGDVDRMMNAIAAGANLECYNHNGYTPLHLAVENLHLDAGLALLEAGADVNGQTANGFWTPIAHAADIVSDAASQASSAPNNNLLCLLICWDADVNAPTSMNATPLDILSRYLNPEGSTLLRDAGAIDRPP